MLRHIETHVINDSDSDNDDGVEHEVSQLYQNLEWRTFGPRQCVLSLEQVQAAYANQSSVDRELLISDTACAMSIAGKLWLNDDASCIKNNYQIEPYVYAEQELFAFGNCENQVSEHYWRSSGHLFGYPAAIGTSGLAGWSPLLLSLNQQGSLGI